MNINVAILITTYNGAATIKMAIEGIKNCLSQIDVPIDLYIYDDCSEDNTIEVINDAWGPGKERIAIIKNDKNLGLFQNKNKALKQLAPKYDWVFLMDQDDYPYNRWTSTLLETIKTHANTKTFIVWSSYDEYNHNTHVLHKSGEITNKISVVVPTAEKLTDYIKNIYTSYCISGSALNCKLIKEVRFFNEKYSHFGDTDFFIRGMLMGYNHIYIGSPLLVRGTSVSQASSVHKKSFKDIKEMDRYYNSFSKYLSKRNKFLFSKYLFILSVKRLGKEFLSLNFRRGFSLVGHSAKLGLHVIKSYL
jgi:glycosyltransferase involved in cell wall biosynthesis